jgi:thiosulfate/3-mercaptopyruvate sulfurtransferase
LANKAILDARATHLYWLPMDSLISTDMLADRLGQPNLRIADATWFLPNEGRDARAEFEAAHIPSAVFLDLAQFANRESDLPMMLPSPLQFAELMAARGFSYGDSVLLYDNSSFGSAARAWWIMSRIFGMPHVAVLDGGFAKWTRERRPTEAGAVSLSGSPFEEVSANSFAWSKDDMLTNLEEKRAQVIDARGPGRYSGAEPEPRPGMASGHIPGSINVPYGALYSSDGIWKRGDALRRAFEEHGVDLTAPVVTTCGSGMSAAVLAFGLHLLGKDDVTLYDGSWSEWGFDPSTPKATGLS